MNSDSSKVKISRKSTGTEFSGSYFKGNVEKPCSCKVSWSHIAEFYTRIKLIKKNEMKQRCVLVEISTENQQKPEKTPKYFDLVHYK